MLIVAYSGVIMVDSLDGEGCLLMKSRWILTSVALAAAGLAYFYGGNAPPSRGPGESPARVAGVSPSIVPPVGATPPGVQLSRDPPDGSAPEVPGLPVQPNGAESAAAAEEWPIRVTDATTILSDKMLSLGLPETFVYFDFGGGDFAQCSYNSLADGPLLIDEPEETTLARELAILAYGTQRLVESYIQGQLETLGSEIFRFDDRESAQLKARTLTNGTVREDYGRWIALSLTPFYQSEEYQLRVDERVELFGKLGIEALAFRLLNHEQELRPGL
jgi:hypothetical protein